MSADEVLLFLSKQGFIHLLQVISFSYLFSVAKQNQAHPIGLCVMQQFYYQSNIFLLDEHLLIADLEVDHVNTLAKAIVFTH